MRTARRRRDWLRACVDVVFEAEQYQAGVVVPKGPEEIGSIMDKEGREDHRCVSWRIFVDVK